MKSMFDKKEIPKAATEFKRFDFITYLTGDDEFKGRILEVLGDGKYKIEYCVSSKSLDNPLIAQAKVEWYEIRKIHM